MKIASLMFELHLGHAQSLKAKRHSLKSLKERIASRFNVSIAEVAHQESWQRASLGLCICTEDEQSAQRILTKIESFARSHPECSVIAAKREIFEFEGSEQNYGINDAPDYSFYSELFDEDQNTDESSND